MMRNVSARMTSQTAEAIGDKLAPSWRSDAMINYVGSACDLFLRWTHFTAFES